MMKSVLLCIFGIASLCTISKACRCAPRHPQTNFCEADYAIKADILSEEKIGPFGGRRYRVKVLENYKNGYAKPFKFSEVWIYSTDVCRVTLDTRSTYIITGAIRNNNFTASSCSWNVKTSALTTYQSNALSNSVYRNNCNCKIKECQQNDCKQGEGCSVPYEKRFCYHQKAVCKQSSYANICGWTSNTC